MRRYVSIAFVVAAMSMIVAALAVPHCHHDGGACIAETEFVDASQTVERKDVDCCDHAHDDAHVHLFALILPDLLPENPIVEVGFPDLVTHYTSVDIHSGTGLRAPPVTLC